MKKILTCIVAITLLLMAGCNIKINRDDNGASVSNYSDAQLYKPGNTKIDTSIKELKITYVSGNVTIEPSNGKTVDIVETANKELKDDEKVQYYLDGTTLNIQFARSNTTIPSDVIKNLTVSIPADMMLDSLEIDTVSANAQIKNIKTKEFEHDSTSGDLDATFNGTLQEAESDTTSGKINIQANIINKLAIDTTSGDIHAKADSIPSCSFKTASGKIDVQISQSISNKCKLNTTSGNVELALPASANPAIAFDSLSGKVSNAFGTTDTNSGTDNLNYMIDSISGNATIRKL